MKAERVRTEVWRMKKDKTPKSELQNTCVQAVSAGSRGNGRNSQQPWIKLASTQKLLHREDWRNRDIRLAGGGVTSKSEKNAKYFTKCKIVYTPSGHLLVQDWWFPPLGMVTSRLSTSRIDDGEEMSNRKSLWWHLEEMVATETSRRRVQASGRKSPRTIRGL